MSRFGTSWTIVRYSFHIMRRHPRLLAFPVISLLAFALIGVTMMAPLFLEVTASQMWRSLWSEEAREAVAAAFRAVGDPSHVETRHVLTMGYIAYNLISTFVMTFINVAFYSQIIEAMSGDRCRVMKGFSQASARMPAIAAWTIVAGTVSVIIGAVQESSSVWLGAVMGLAGLCWTAVSFFVIPVMLNEPGSRTPLEYLKISIALLKRVWAEALIGMGAMTIVIIALMIALSIVNFAMFAARGGDALPTASLVAAMGSGIFVLLYLALQIFECGLYVFATQGVAPGTFDPDTFERAWTVRDSSQGTGAIEPDVSRHARRRKPWSAGMRRAMLGLVAALGIAMVLLWRNWMGPPRIVDDVAATEVAQDLPRLRPPDVSGSTPAQDEAVTRVVLKEYPFLKEMPDFDGSTIVDIAMREDGSVYRSRIMSVTPDNRQAMMSDPSDILPQQPAGRSGIVFRKGTAAGDQKIRHDFWIRYVILAEEPDSSRDLEHVRTAMLASHPDLLLPVDGDRVNKATVYLSEDGKVDRHYVENFSMRDARPYGDQVPEVFGRNWEALGLRLDQLGPMGITWIHAPIPGGTGPEWKNQGRMVVRYAWARRADEPIGGVPLAQRHPRILPFTHADVSTVIEHYLPGALNDKGRTRSGTPWLVLSPKGDVVRSGYIKTGLDQEVDAGIFEAKHPDEQIGMVLETLVVRKWKESFSHRVIIAWLRPAGEARQLPTASTLNEAR